MFFYIINLHPSYKIASKRIVSHTQNRHTYIAHAQIFVFIIFLEFFLYITKFILVIKTQTNRFTLKTHIYLYIILSVSQCGWPIKKQEQPYFLLNIWYVPFYLLNMHRCEDRPGSLLDRIELATCMISVYYEYYEKIYVGFQIKSSLLFKFKYRLGVYQFLFSNQFRCFNVNMKK